MNFLEKDLEDIIWENANSEIGREALRLRGLDIKGKLYRQVNLKNYGILDLVSIYITHENISITVYELKKDKIDINAMMQSFRYLTALRSICDEIIYKRDFLFQSVLIGNSVDNNADFTFLYNFSPLCDIYTYSYKLDGLRFKRESKDFVLSNCNLFLDNNLSIGEIREMMNAEFSKNKPFEEELPF